MLYESYGSARKAMWEGLINELNIEDSCSVVIFGGGWMGTELLKYFKDDLRNRIVSFCDNNKAIWGVKRENIEIRSPENATSQFPDATYVIAIARGMNDVKIQLEDLGISEEKIKLFRLNDNGVSTRKYLSERLDDKYEIVEDFPAEASVPVVRNTDRSDKRDFRIAIDPGLGYRLDLSGAVFSGNVMDEYERNFGPYIALSDYKRRDKKNTVKIMIARSHMDYADMETDNPDIYIPVQAGRALTDIDICEFNDNTGHSISNRNYNYCECSVLYWAWKNGFEKDSDYLGLRHYRRRFEATDDELRYLACNDIDIVHLDPMYHENIKASFSFHTKNENDWDVMKAAIDKIFPQYNKAMEIYENQHFVCGYNMNILRRDIFDEYCKFLFGVLLYVEDHYLKICDRRDRYLGFLAENLFGIFLIKHKDDYRSAVTKLVPYIKY